MEVPAVSPVSKRTRFAVPPISLCSAFAKPCAEEGCENRGCLGHAGHIEKIKVFDPSTVAAEAFEKIANDGLTPAEVTAKVQEAVRRADLARRIAHTKARRARGLEAPCPEGFRGRS